MTTETLADIDLILDEKSLAELLRVSCPTIRRLWCRGELPRPIQIGRQNRWRRDDILKWIAGLDVNDLHAN